MLSIKGLVKTFSEGKGTKKKQVKAVDGISFDVEPGELYTLLGPSGCGKSTTLRCLAGLEEPDEGTISLRDRVLYDFANDVNVPPHRRGLGMVFQSYAIWPHMNVYKNVVFPLTHGRWSERVTRVVARERVDRVLEAVKLIHLRDRPATDLSGGQQQRLALARALVMESPLLLLDEPLSNLDAKLREEMRFELKRLQQDLGITSIYVTHDQIEALAMSSKIAVMNDGRLEQVGTPSEIYNNPATRFVADFIGTTNFLEGKIVEVVAAEEYRVETPHGSVLVEHDVALPIGTPATVLVRPERLTLEEGSLDAPMVGKLPGTVDAWGFLGNAVEHRVRVGDMFVRVRSSPSIAIAPNTPVIVGVPSKWATLLPEPAPE